MGKLVKCKTCGAEIAKTAKRCPKCGAQQHIVALTIAYLLGIVVFVLIMRILFIYLQIIFL